MRKTTMKRMFLILTIVALAAVPAHAALVTSADALFYMDPIETNFNLLDWENLNDNDSDGVLSVGDTLQGILYVSHSYAAGEENRYPDGFDLTGLFEVEVTDKATSTDAFQFGPTASFEAVYGTGAMISLFVDSTPDFNAAAATVAAAEALVTDGSLYLVLGATSGDWGSDWYWGSVGPEDPVDNITNQTVFASVLKVLTNNSGIPVFLPKETEAAPSYWDTFKDGDWPTALQLLGVTNEVSVSGKIAYDQVDAYPAYELTSTDPAQTYATPEPASLLVWSMLGLIGLGVTWYHRRHALR